MFNIGYSRIVSQSAGWEGSQLLLDSYDGNKSTDFVEVIKNFDEVKEDTQFKRFA